MPFVFSLLPSPGSARFGREAAVWGVVGGFFGLCLVMVRLWEKEGHPNVFLSSLEPFVVLRPEFIERLKSDEDFYEEHFERLYPDGLTLEQVDALKPWCEENGIEKVPLETTIAFAQWIFIGYFVTYLIKGNILQFLF